MYACVCVCVFIMWVLLVMDMKCLHGSNQYIQDICLKSSAFTDLLKQRLSSHSKGMRTHFPSHCHCSIAHSAKTQSSSMIVKSKAPERFKIWLMDSGKVLSCAALRFVTPKKSNENTWGVPKVPSFGRDIYKCLRLKTNHRIIVSVAGIQLLESGADYQGRSGAKYEHE